MFAQNLQIVMSHMLGLTQILTVTNLRIPFPSVFLSFNSRLSILLFPVSTSGFVAAIVIAAAVTLSLPGRVVRVSNLRTVSHPLCKSKRVGTAATLPASVCVQSESCATYFAAIFIPIKVMKLPRRQPRDVRNGTRRN